jgi:hypothetical protein
MKEASGEERRWKRGRRKAKEATTEAQAEEARMESD